MTTVLRWDPARIATTEERRMATVMREVSLEHSTFDPIVCANGGEGSWQNQAIVTPYEGEPDGEALDKCDAFFVERGVEPKVCAVPHVHPGLIEALGSRGYTLKEVELKYAIDLTGGLPAGRAVTLTAWAGNEAIGVCGHETFEDVAALWGGAVVEHHRGRGVLGDDRLLRGASHGAERHPRGDASRFAPARVGAAGRGTDAEPLTRGIRSVERFTCE